MIIDTSALIAILFDEAPAARLVDAIAASELRRVGAPTLVETAAVMNARKGPAGEIVLDALMARLGIGVAPFTSDAAARARAAYQRFGRGIGSPGVLNFADCLAYGVSKSMGEPLLFVGEDFSRTDVDVAPY